MFSRKQVKTFCNKNNIDIFEAPVNEHRDIGLVERLIQTIKNRLAVIKEEKLPTRAFHVKHALKIIIHQLRICKQRTTKTSPFGANFGRKPNTPLSVIATRPNLLNLTYKNIINHYLDEDTVMPEEILPEDNWLNGYRSDIEVEISMSRASTEARSRERASMDGESRFLKTKAIRPIPEGTCGGAKACTESAWRETLQKEHWGTIWGTCAGISYFKSKPYNIHDQGTRETDCDSTQQRYCEIRHADGTTNSPKGLCRPKRASIRRKDSGRTDTQPHQEIYPQTERGQKDEAQETRPGQRGLVDQIEHFARDARTNSKNAQFSRHAKSATDNRNNLA